MNYIEFITTTTYINKYLKKNDRILEVGAGTGAYYLYYAYKGDTVDSIELVSICEREDLIGYSDHILSIIEK